MAKTASAAPGTTSRSIGSSICRKMWAGPKPKLSASRIRSAGIACQPCRIIRVASGMFRNTCASTTPPRPKIEIWGRPRSRKAVLKIPDRPKIASRPSTATITGSRKGAPRAEIASARPGKRRRAKARASGMAQITEASAESTACSTVKRSAARSAAPGIPPPARHSTAATGPSVSAARARAVVRAISAPAPRAILPAPDRAVPKPHPRPEAAIFPVGSGFQTLWANLPPGYGPDTSSSSPAAPSARHRSA